MFMLIIDKHDMKNIIRQTKNFIKIYIEKDIIDEDSFTQLSLDSSIESTHNKEISSRDGDHSGKGLSAVSKFETKPVIMESQEIVSLKLFGRILTILGWNKQSKHQVDADTGS
jgi:hypothetical protein